MKSRFISLKKQMKFGSIPFIGVFIVLIMLLVNVSEMPKRWHELLASILLIISIGFVYVVSLLVPDLPTKINQTITTILEIAILLLTYYAMTLAFILSQLPVLKIIKISESKPKKLKEEDILKYI